MKTAKAAVFIKNRKEYSGITYMRKRGIWKYILILLVLGVFVFGIESNQKNVMESAIEDTEWGYSNDGLLTKTIFLEAFGKGEYIGEITLDAEENGSWKLLDMTRNNGDNELGLEVTSGKILQGAGNQQFEFTLKNQTENLSLEIAAAEGKISIYSWKIECVNDGYTDSILIFIIMLAMLLFIIKAIKSQRGRRWILVIGAGVAVNLPGFFEQLYYGHDIAFHINRIAGMADAIMQGQFPVRMNYAFNSGYGFANSLLYPELFLYIPALLCILGTLVMTAYKVLILAINIASAAVGYYSFKRILNSDKWGLVCTLVYLLTPYRLSNIYCRAAIGEAIAAIFLPLLLLGIYELLFRDMKKWYLTVVAATGILQSHILSLEIALAFTVLVFICRLGHIIKYKETTRILYMVKSGIFIILLNIWFIIPFLEQFRQGYFIVESRTELYASAVPLWQMFFSNKAMVKKVPLSLGMVLFLGMILFSYYCWYRQKISEDYKKLGISCMILGILCCYMASTLFPWKLIQKSEPGNDLLAVIQFPWRMLGFGGVFLCIVATIAIKELWKDKLKIFVGLMGLLLVQSAVMCIDESFSVASVYLWNRDSVIKNAEYKDYYQDSFDMEVIKERSDKVIADENIQISRYKKTGGKLTFCFEKSGIPEDAYLHCPYYNYESYRAFINGEEVPVETDAAFMAAVKIPDDIEKGTIQIDYVGRKLYRAGDIISCVFIVFLSCAGIYRMKRKKSADIRPEVS